MCRASDLKSQRPGVNEVKIMTVWGIAHALLFGGGRRAKGGV